MTLLSIKDILKDSQTNALENLKAMDNFLEKYNFLKLTQEEI